MAPARRMTMTVKLSREAKAVSASPGPHPLRLEQGDVLDQPTFHERYEAMAEYSDAKAELVGGVVIMPSPLMSPHGETHALVMQWLGVYWTHVDWIKVLDNATVILGDDAEPQPDATICVSPERGGKTKLVGKGYVAGPPELIVEVAASSVSYDLHQKKADYENHGVAEYLVVVVDDERIEWFTREAAGAPFAVMPASDDGLYKSRVLPGLWLDPVALFAGKPRALADAVERGVAHAKPA